MILYIPNKINFTIIKSISNNNKCVIIYSGCNFITIKINNIYYDKKINCVHINKNSCGVMNVKTLVGFVFAWSNFFYKKLTFKGKGYKVVKRGSFLLLNFNHAHLTWLLLFNTLCLKRSKSKYILLLKNCHVLESLIKSVVDIRRVNIFTKRGIKLSKQKIFKKVGKRV